MPEVAWMPGVARMPGAARMPDVALAVCGWQSSRRWAYRRRPRRRLALRRVFATRSTNFSTYPQSTIGIQSEAKRKPKEFNAVHDY